MNENAFDLTKAAAITGILLVIGGGLKHYVPFLPNKYIPLVTLTLGVAGYLVWTRDYSISNIAAALYVALSATGAHSASANIARIGKPDDTDTAMPIDTGGNQGHDPEP